MKKVLLLMMMLGILFIYSCAGEESCKTAGCDDGFHCTTEEKCEKDCSEELCSKTNQSCNAETGLCETLSCVETGCEENYICDTETKACKPDTSCRVVGCENNFLCNEDTGVCEAACIKNTCQDGFSCNEELGTCYPNCSELGCKTDYICDESTQLCQPDQSCRVVACQDYYKCNETSGLCEPACGELGCQTNYICNSTTQLCEEDTTCRTQGCQTDYSCNTTSGLCEHIACTYNSCASNLICNVHNGFCEAATEYPAGGITNRTWTDTEGKTFSFKFLYNSYIKTGYPKAILLDASAGWCPHCREETPAIKEIYNESVTGNYHKIAVLQEICEDNNHNPASMSFARGWKSQYGLSYSVSIGTQVRTFRGGVLPVYVIIDVKTMKVHKVTDPREFPDMSAPTTKSFLYGYINTLYNRN